MIRVVPALAGSIALLLALASVAHGGTLQVGRDGADLVATIAAAHDGDLVEVPRGTWHGPIRIERRITLRGTGGVIDGGGHGTVVVITAPGATIEGLTVRGSGTELSGMQPDSCIWVEKSATGAVVRNNSLSDCAFGIWVNTTHKAELIGNHVYGRTEQRPTDRGNGIQLFDGSELVVRGNVVTGARDGIYVSAVEDSLIEDNQVRNQRYGVHYMYSQRNTLRNNVSEDNLSGFALMESHDLTVVGNVARHNEHHGILFRDATGCIIRDNRLIENGEGLFFFSSADNQIQGNRMVGNKVGAKIWAGSQRNTISGNAFIANRQQVFYVGATDLVLGKDGPGNFWSDYVGWDQNGDGVGDRPYRMASFTSRLVYKYPAAAMLTHSPAVELLSHLEERMPLLTAPTVVNRSPLTRDPTS